MDNSKSKKRKALTTALAVILAIALVFGGSTFAYLQASSDDVVNEFKTNQVTVDLKETTGNEYNIIPGTSQEKDPTVTVSTTVPAYVYVEVTDTTDNLVEYAIAAGWMQLDGYDNVYYREADANAAFPVLENNRVSYSSFLTNSDMLIQNEDGTYSLKDGITLSFNASAIQKEPFDDAVEAYMALNNEWIDVTDKLDMLNGHVGYWDRYGYMREINGYHYINIPVIKGEQYRISGTAGAGDPRFIMLKNALGLEEYISMYPEKETNTKTVYENEVITIPEGCNWLCISIQDKDASLLKVEKLGSGQIGVQPESDFYWDFGGKKYLTITIDDSRSDIDKCQEVFDKYNVPANYAAIVTTLDHTCTDGQSVKEVLLDAQSKGSEILAHAEAPLTADSSNEHYRRVYIEDKKTLEDNGFIVNGIITAGAPNFKTQDYSKTLALAKEANYLYADLTTRGSDIYNKRYYNPRNAMADTNLSAVYASMDAIKNTGEGWFNGYCHGQADLSLENLESIIQYAIANGFEIVTWNTVYNECGRTR